MRGNCADVPMCGRADVRSCRLAVSFLVIMITAVILLACSPGARNTTHSPDLRERVRKITLDNGMTFLLVNRGSAPVFAAHLKVRVGNIEEEEGASGLAHFFEHLAFKGTDKIGTNDFAREKPVLDNVLAVGTEIAALKKAGKPVEEIAALIERRKTLEAEENSHTVKNDYITQFHRRGGRDLNASTSNDFTTYYVTLPVSYLELWAYLESERLKNRVFREFFTEVDVVSEERRMRIDNSPDGKLFEAYLAAGFDKSPYRYHPIGSSADIAVYTPEVARAFYERYYIPSRMVAVLVGNFDVDETEAVVRRYFSALEKSPDRPKAVTLDTPDATYPRSTEIRDPSRPRFYFGYHRPAHPHPDDILLDVVRDLLCEGRTSRLYQRLVLNDRSVAYIGCFASIPGARLPGLFTFMGVPLGEHGNREIQEIVREELRTLGVEGPTADELQRVKNQIEADFVYGMEKNAELAANLAFYESLTGDWRYMYDKQNRINAITQDDIKRVVKTYFVPQGEVSAYLEEEVPQ